MPAGACTCPCVCLTWQFRAHSSPPAMFFAPGTGAVGDFSGHGVSGRMLSQPVIVKATRFENAVRFFCDGAIFLNRLRALSSQRAPSCCERTRAARHFCTGRVSKRCPHAPAVSPGRPIVSLDRAPDLVASCHRPGRDPHPASAHVAHDHRAARPANAASSGPRPLSGRSAGQSLPQQRNLAANLRTSLQNAALMGSLSSPS